MQKTGLADDLPLAGLIGHIYSKSATARAIRRLTRKRLVPTIPTANANALISMFSVKYPMSAIASTMIDHSTRMDNRFLKKKLGLDFISTSYKVISLTS